MLRLRLTETDGDAGPRRRAALPDPDRAAAPPLRRRRGGAARRAVRRDAAVGRLAAAVPVDARRRRSSPASPASTEVDLPVTCTYDFEVAAAKYLHALDDGEIPLVAAVLRHRVRARRRRASSAAAGRVARGGVVPAAGRGVARRDGPLLPEQRLAAAEPRHARRAHPLQGRAGAARRGTTPSSSCSRKPGRRARDRPTRPTGSPRPAPSPTPCSTRATCSTRTARRRRRTSCAGSSACSRRRALRRGRRLRALGRCAPRSSSIPAATPACRVRIRCLQVQHRSVEAVEPDGIVRAGRRGSPSTASRWVAVGRGGRARARPRRAAAPAGDRRAARGARSSSTAATSTEVLTDSDGRVVGRAVRRREPVDGLVTRRRRRGPTAPRALVKLTVEVENTTDWRGDGRRPGRGRCARSLVAVHTLLAVDDGDVRLAARPARRPRAAAVAGCAQRRHLPGADRRRRASATSCCRRRSSSTTTRRSRPESAGRPLRRDRDRRDPRPAGADADRRGEGRGARHRPPRRGDRRPLRRHAARGLGAPARRGPLDRPVGRRGRADRATARPLPWWDPGVDAGVDPWTDTVLDRRGRGRQGHAGAAAPVAAGRRPRPVPRRPDGHGRRRVPRRRRRRARRRDRSTTTRPPSCSSGRAATCTSTPTRSSRCAMTEPRVARRRHRQHLPRRRRLRRRGRRPPAPARPLPDGVRVADFGIRGVHLAYELLDGYDALVLVDAVPMGEPPGTVAVIEPEPPVDSARRRRPRRRRRPLDEPGRRARHARRPRRHGRPRAGRRLPAARRSRRASACRARSPPRSTGPSMRCWRSLAELCVPNEERSGV